jgi:hypothetical protein
MKYEKEKLVDILGHVENMIKIFKSDAASAAALEKKIGRKPSKDELKLLESTRDSHVAKLEELKALIVDEISMEERTHGEVLEHKHDSYPHWHPAARVHTTE